MANTAFTDEELYAAEQAQARKDADQLERDQQQEAELRLARAGDPEARAALEAAASMLVSQLAGPPEPNRSSARKPRVNPPAPKPAPAKPPPPAETGRIRPREISSDTDSAYALMDVMFRRWKRDVERDPRKANRALARDLGGDTVIFLKAGIVRLGDQLDMMLKLSALAKPKEEEEGGGEDYESEMDSLRKAIRGDSK